MLAATQALEHFLRAALGPFGNGGKAVGLAQQGIDGDGEDGEFAVADSPGQTGGGDLPQSLGRSVACLSESCLGADTLGSSRRRERLASFSFTRGSKGRTKTILGCS